MFALFLHAVAGGLAGVLSGSYFSETDLELRNNIVAGCAGGLCIGQYVIALIAQIGVPSEGFAVQLLAGLIGGAVLQMLFGFFANASFDDLDGNS